jgi:hypothetical protein
VAIQQHDFRASLAKSEEVARASWWETVYRQAFPDFERMSAPVIDLAQQRLGIDRVITLLSGREIYVDEKVRGRTRQDIVFEKWSSVEHKRPGWIEKPLSCDYIAYAFTDSEVCYVIPYQGMKRIWRAHEQEWTQRYGRSYKLQTSQNNGYTTAWLAVPLAVVLLAMSSEAIWCTWASEDGLPFDGEGTL